MSIINRLKTWWLLSRNPSLRARSIRLKESNNADRTAVAVVQTGELIDYGGDTFALTMLVSLKMYDDDSIDIDCQGFEWQCIGYGNSTMPVNMTPDLDRKADLMMVTYLEYNAAETAVTILNLCEFKKQ